MVETDLTSAEFEPINVDTQGNFTFSTALQKLRRAILGIHNKIFPVYVMNTPGILKGAQLLYTNTGAETSHTFIFTVPPGKRWSLLAWSILPNSTDLTLCLPVRFDVVVRGVYTGYFGSSIYTWFPLADASYIVAPLSVQATDRDGQQLTFPILLRPGETIELSFYMAGMTPTSWGGAGAQAVAYVLFYEEVLP
jgi:hypothetical protein